MDQGEEKGRNDYRQPCLALHHGEQRAQYRPAEYHLLHKRSEEAYRYIAEIAAYKQRQLIFHKIRQLWHRLFEKRHGNDGAQSENHCPEQHVPMFASHIIGRQRTPLQSIEHHEEHYTVYRRSEHQFGGLVGCRAGDETIQWGYHESCYHLDDYTPKEIGEHVFILCFFHIGKSFVFLFSNTNQ